MAVNLTLNSATTTLAGIMSASQATSLSTVTTALSNTEGIHYGPISVSLNTANAVVSLQSISSTNTSGTTISYTLPAATSTASGVMSAALASTVAIADYAATSGVGFLVGLGISFNTTAGTISYTSVDSPDEDTDHTLTIPSVTSSAAGLVPSSWYTSLNNISGNASALLVNYNSNLAAIIPTTSITPDAIYIGYDVNNTTAGGVYTSATATAIYGTRTSLSSANVYMSTSLPTVTASTVTDAYSVLLLNGSSLVYSITLAQLKSYLGL